MKRQYMGMIDRTTSILRPFFYGLLFGVIFVYGGILADKYGYIDTFLEVFADVGVIRPNDDGGTNQGTLTTCGAASSSSCLDEVVTAPTAPSTSGDYITWARNQLDFFQMGTLSGVSSVSQVQIPVYHIDLQSNMQLDVSLWNAAETTQYGSTVQFTSRTSAQWDTATFSGLSLTQAQLDGLRVRLNCLKVGGGSNSNCRAFAMYGSVTYTPTIDVTVGQTGTQQNVDVGATNAYIGGLFTITENTSSRNITSITINETGSVDAANNLKNIKLFYKLDNTSPYNCASHPYSATSTQFGSTDADGFSAANGSSVFTASPGPVISTTATLCVAAVMDVQSGATQGQEVEVQITNPSTEVVGSGSPNVSPATAVLLSGTTVLLQQDLRQIHYHWRLNDVETEAGASSATGGTDDTTFDSAGKSTTYRLRLEVSNEGNKTSAATQYRIEYGMRDTTCAALSGGDWVDVGAGGGDWDMADVLLVSDGANTTNIAEGTGGVADENSTFLTPNGGFKDSGSQTGNITLTSTEFVELEYAMSAASGVTDGTTYCFRVTDAGTAIDNYDVYPQLTIAADTEVSTEGSQISTISIPDTTIHVGTFTITNKTSGAKTVQDITLTASGTVDFVNDVDNVLIRYDAPVGGNCAAQSYAVTDLLFDSTTAGFNANGTTTLSGTVVLAQNAAMCAYVVLDVGSGASDGEIFDIQLTNPSTDIVMSTGSVAPASLLHIPGVTTLTSPNVVQEHYHWRNNDNTGESDSTSATGGTEDTIWNELPQNTIARLRLGVQNKGGESGATSQYRLEWGRKITTCAAITGGNWIDVDTANDEFEIAASLLSDGSNTTDIGGSIGGVSNDSYTFYIANTGQEDSSSQTGSITIPSNNILELEYSIRATATSTEGASYCFRVTDAGTEIDGYTRYPEVNIKPRTDFVVTRGVTTITGGSASASLTEGSQYDLQFNDASRAFIRITNTGITGAGPTTGGNNNASDVTAYVSNPGNIASGITFTRAGTAGDTRIAWEVIEYIGGSGGENEIIVRGAGVATYGTGNTTVTTGTISGIVDDNDVLPWITGQGNPDTGRFDYNVGLSTSAWNAGGDTITFERGESGSDAVNVSYAAIEFTGLNWNIQRHQHTYDSAGTASTSPLTTPVGSITKAFIHSQKRVGSGLDTHADFGQTVYLSGMATIVYTLDGSASTPGSHVGVSWIVENTQDTGSVMKVHRSNDTIAAGGAAPVITYKAIGATLDDLAIASIFTMNTADGTGRTYQEPIMSVRLLNSSTTDYEIWRGDPGDSVTYRTEVVEWPTGTPKLFQNDYGLYEDNDALLPTVAWAGLGENAEMTASNDPMASGEFIRLRMSLRVTSATQPAGLAAFKLQYGARTTTCSAITAWNEIGDSSSTTALWRGNAATPVDGTALSGDPPTGGDLLLSESDVAGTYEEANNSAVNPFSVSVNEAVEYDWNLENNNAIDKTSYCFRMIFADGTPLDGYDRHPVVRTVGYEPQLWDWKWFDDETSLTPSTALSATNSAPTDIANDNIIKLRAVVSELSGAAGVDAKFKLQYSEYSDFSEGVFNVVASSTCAAEATTTSNLWCYDDGAGVDNAVVDDNTLSSADTCSGGSGNGCGTHNEGTASTTATFDHPALANTEFEFTLRNDGARANAVYYFRLFDVQNNVSVMASSSYPSLVVEGAQLVFTLTGVSSGTDSEGVTSDVATTPTSIPFGSVPLDTEYEAIYRLSIDTSATQGYKILMFARQALLNTYADPIPNVTGTNASPSGWSTGCDAAAIGCFGYHVGDDTLEGGSTRFAANDSYAAIDTTPQEVMYSSVPANESSDMVYKIQVSGLQPAGDYETEIVYLAIPVF